MKIKAYVQIIENLFNYVGMQNSAQTDFKEDLFIFRRKMVN